MSAARRPIVLVVMGVSGVGKTTVATALAARLGWDRGEGDDLHPAGNVAKMRAGTPLTDEDRWPWLDRVGDWIRDHLEHGRPGVITCSALTHGYRDRLRAPGVVFVHLAAVTDVVESRLEQRVEHFMPAGLLASQVSTLEPLRPDEVGLVVRVDRATPDDTVEEIVARWPAVLR